MSSFIKTMDELPFWAKVVLALPVLDIIWAIYRIVKGYNDKNNTNLIIGIVWLILGSYTILWLVDLIFVIMKKPLLFTE